MALIVSVSGVRGIVGAELTAEVALRFAAAFGTYIGGGKVAVGRDGRPSGHALNRAVIAGLTGVGCAVEELAIVPTPTIGLLVRHLQCRGGIQITASHNPAPYNGLKLFAGDGAVLPANMGREVQNRYLAGNIQWADWAGTGEVNDSTNAWLHHRDRVVDTVDLAALRGLGQKIVLDANGGAGGPLGCAALQSFGCEVIPVACEPDGVFRHEPEPMPAHLGGIEAIVKQNPGAIGAVLDPDSDRLVLIDESGHCLSEELTLALAVQQRLEEQRGAVVVNLSTSRVTEDIAKAAGVPFFRSPVGEANVVEKMRQVDAIIGGEGNGGVIDPRIGWVRDPFIGLGLILSRMAATGKTLQRLADDLPRYAIQKSKLSLPREKLALAIAAMRSHWPDTALDDADGLRLDWADSWVQVRGSNTEPIVRIIAEATTPALATQLCEDARRVLQSA